MIIWLVFFGTIYMLLLAYVSYRTSKTKTTDAKSYALGGGNLKLGLGILTYCATLFSTFTLMGMPDFFRTHGVGAWVFLGITDVAIAFMILFVGIIIHKKFNKYNYYSVGSFIKDAYQSSFAYFVYIACIFIFLIPYTSIQIKGLSEFLTHVIPFNFSPLYWSVFMLAVILSYSSVGGFKAIVYSDAIQAIILLFVIWFIAYYCIDHFGGLSAMFAKVEQTNPKLLSVPGPHNLFTSQFLISSFIAIVIMPITQPQLTTRLIAMKSTASLKQMAPATAIFAFIVIFPTIILGMYGAVNYSELPAEEFWAKLLVLDQNPIVGALSIIGLIAAAMSTTDSQLFALGNEANIYFEKNKYLHLKTKILIFLFAVASLIFAIYSNNQIVPLARLSFAGTALIAPMIILAIAKGPKSHMNHLVPMATLLAMLVFLLTYFFNLIPKMIFDLRVDLWLYAILSLIAGSYYLITRKN